MPFGLVYRTLLFQIKTWNIFSSRFPSLPFLPRTLTCWSGSWSWEERSVGSSRVSGTPMFLFGATVYLFSLTYTWLCFQIVSSIDRGSTSPVSWLRFSDMKRSTWVLSEFSQVFFPPDKNLWLQLLKRECVCQRQNVNAVFEVECGFQVLGAELDDTLDLEKTWWLTFTESQ